MAGSGHGEVGFGTGKAGEVPEAIGKAGRTAKKAMKKMILKENGTNTPSSDWPFWRSEGDYHSGPLLELELSQVGQCVRC